MQPHISNSGSIFVTPLTDSSNNLTEPSQESPLAKGATESSGLLGRISTEGRGVDAPATNQARAISRNTLFNNPTTTFKELNVDNKVTREHLRDMSTPTAIKYLNGKLDEVREKEELNLREVFDEELTIPSSTSSPFVEVEDNLSPKMEEASEGSPEANYSDYTNYIDQSPDPDTGHSSSFHSFPPTPPLSPPVPGPSPTVQAPGNPPVPVTLKSIQDEVKKSKLDVPPQEVLGGAMDKLKAQAPPGSKIEIKTSLDKDPNGEYVVEPFSHSDTPGSTFYKVKASFTVTVTDPSGRPVLDPSGQPLQVKLERDIYTTASTPQEAIFAASGFKQAVRNTLLAKEDGSLTGTKLTNLMKAATFHSQFDRNSVGFPIRLRSLMGGGEQVSLDFKQKVATRQLGGKIIKHAAPLSNNAFDPTGAIHYKSPGEKLRYAKIKIKGTGTDVLNHIQDRDLYIRQMAKDIEYLQDEFKRGKSLFKQEAFFSWIKSKETAEFKSFIEDLRTLNGADPTTLTNQDPTFQQLSPTMQKYVIEQQRIKVDRSNLENQQNQIKLVGQDIDTLQNFTQNMQVDPNLAQLDPAWRDYISNLRAKHQSVLPPQIPTFSALLLELKKAEEASLPQIEKSLRDLDAKESQIRQESLPFVEQLVYLEEIQQQLEAKLAHVDLLIDGFKTLQNQSASQAQTANVKKELANLAKLHENLKKDREENKKFIDAVTSRLDEVTGPWKSQQAVGASVIPPGFVPGSTNTEPEFDEFVIEEEQPPIEGQPPVPETSSWSNWPFPPTTGTGTENLEGAESQGENKK